MVLGFVAHLYRYPTKSLAGEELRAVDVTKEGVARDRIRALHVATADHARSGKPYRGKEDSGLHLLGRIEEAIALGARHGVALARVEGGRHFDAAPISLIFDTWLGDASARCGIELEPMRFRPNIVVRAEAGFLESEASFIGARLRIGTVDFEVLDTIRRCVTPTYDLRTGESNPDILRTIAQERDNVMGIYCAVITPGHIPSGAAVERL
ncbi:MAG: MOSC domain-containing protein [Candidatus Baltobacteraceae bacterium]